MLTPHFHLEKGKVPLQAWTRPWGSIRNHLYKEQQKFLEASYYMAPSDKGVCFYLIMPPDVTVYKPRLKETRYLRYRRLGGPQGRYGVVRKILWGKPVQLPFCLSQTSYRQGHILEQSVIILNVAPLFMQLLEARQAVDCMGLATGISQVLFSKVQVFNCTW